LKPNSKPRLVITLPVYKDTTFLQSAINTIQVSTSKLTNNFVILIAEDGSDSSIIVKNLMETFKNITYIQHNERLGRGRALREAWSTVNADVYAYLDVDMAGDLDQLEAYSNLLRLQSEYDLITGSRYLPGSITNRPLIRRFASVGYNWLVRIMFQTGVHDHQCGFKSFSRGLVETLEKEAKSDSWFWDTEAIVIAKRLGYHIKEIPIYWTEKKGKKTPLKRLAKDMLLHGKGLLLLCWRIRILRELRSRS
jgi:glycosyltransferase involved in cell wall biosynthesis